MQLGQRRIEADCVWADQKVIVELDGYAAHGNRHSYEDDRTRDRALKVAGWDVVRITWLQLTSQENAVATDLYALLFRS